MIALVLLDIASSILLIFILYVGMSISTNTGTQPNCIKGLIVVGNPAATVIISSPF